MDEGQGQEGPGSDGHRPRPVGRPRWVVAILFALGCFCTVVGIVGIILPGLPGTVFLIAAAACFARSSPRFEGWLLDHAVFGPPVRQWRENGAISFRAKVVACVSLAASWALLATGGASPLVLASMAVLFGAVAAFIATRPRGSSAS